MNAKTTPKPQDREPCATGGTDALTIRQRVTPDDHAKASKAKPTRILDVGTGPHGKTVLVEFADGWSRTLDLDSHLDTWHPLFSDISWPDLNRLDAHNPAPVTVHPDGTRSYQDGPLSFVTYHETRRGRLIKKLHFAVPAEDYMHGGTTGYLAAKELIEAMKPGTGGIGHVLPRNVLEEVFSLLSEPFYGTNRRAAASAFTDFVAECVMFASKHAVWDSWLQSRMDNEQKYIDFKTASVAKERAEFVARMKAAREAKRLARVSNTIIWRA